MKFSAYTIGEKFKTATYTMTKEEIQTFAKQFDPQYMHLDEKRAKASDFGGVIASGIHTLNISFKLWIELGIYGDDIIAGRQMDKVTFKKAVYPGDSLQVELEVMDKKALPGRKGLVTMRMTSFNQDRERVMTALLTALIKDE